ncbi:helix-turn-helix transcriptional regulator [Neorhizobium sp. SHOUNA12A]|nr:helix-turn-helix transcriptional regulator [Neorhizobium sp. SHOUNA12A]MCJ9674391.1 helix-turn-helix transcriptional regulator [Neorhizobium sp. SHOUNA12B]MCJ9748970.1 helix-turn-helix transcriptional regulator [Neorhizobium sp. SHOUNA12A]
MARKQSKSKDEIMQNELRAGATAHDLARHLATAGTSKNISGNIAAYSSLAKPAPSAAEIAKAISQTGAVGEVMRNLSVSIPKIDLKLPDVSQRIQASLPRTLVDPSSQTGSSAEKIDQVAATEDAARPENTKQINTPEDLGRMVRDAREERRLSQQAFADLAGVGRRFVSEFENGKTTLEFDKVLKVARAAGISLLARDR